MEREQLTGPLLNSTTGIATISGAVMGPDGNSICDHLARADATTRVSAIATTFGAPGGSTTLTCPVNAFAMVVPDPGTYFLRVSAGPLPSDSRLPRYYLDPGAVEVAGSDVTFDVQVEEGAALGGGAWLYGAPLAGMGLGLTFAIYPGSNYVAGSAISDASGAWAQFRIPAIFQPDVPYIVGGCERLGHTSIGFPRGTFVLPMGGAAIDCRLEVGPTTSFTHQKSKLVVTPFPGDIGGLSPSNELERYGLGFGVQFPADEPSYGNDSWVTDPRGLSQLSKGGLIVGVGDGETGVVLTGFDIGGYSYDCGSACRDFGLDGVRPGESGRRPLNVNNGVLWQYSDALSPEGVGLDVQQRSFDPAGAGDYVLVEFSFKNRSGAPLTFYAGFWGDWDIDEGSDDDVAYVYFTGVPVMIQTNGGGGSHLGTMLLGDYPSAGLFVHGAFLPDPMSVARQLAILKGSETATFATGDTRSMQSVGPIALAPNQKASMWLAIVAGEDETTLLANAELAKADLAAR